MSESQNRVIHSRKATTPKYNTAAMRRILSYWHNGVMLQLGEEHSSKTDKSSHGEGISGLYSAYSNQIHGFMSEYCFRIDFRKLVKLIP